MVRYDVCHAMALWLPRWGMMLRGRVGRHQGQKHRQRTDTYADVVFFFFVVVAVAAAAAAVAPSYILCQKHPETLYLAALSCV